MAAVTQPSFTFTNDFNDLELINQAVAAANAQRMMYPPLSEVQIENIAMQNALQNSQYIQQQAHQNTLAIPFPGAQQLGITSSKSS